MATGTQLEKSGTAIAGDPGLSDRMAGLWGRSRVRWAALQPAQRTGLLVAAVLLTSLAAFLAWYALRTDWRTLYANMDPEDARQTSVVLTQAQIPFEVSASGTSILVPAPQLDKARLATAAKGAMRSGRLGFELFDKPNWVGSEFDEHVNYQRALEGELEHTVGSLADVESARVHLVLPHESLFKESERPAKASVVLKLRHLSLADGEPDAIRNLVSSAVDGLTPDRVVLVDAAGHVPLGPKTADAMRLSAEEALEQKLVATLEPVTGSGNVRASVTLDYDPQAVDETSESYDPDQTVTLQMQRSEQTSGGQQIPAGVPGTASNAPNSQNLPVYPQQTTPPQSSKTETGTYGASKTVRHTSETPGRIRRMTAAIVVNDRLLQAAGKNQGAKWQQRTPDEIRNLTALAQAAVGFDPNRGDLLTVEDFTFDENRNQQPVAWYNQWVNQAERFPVLIKYAALVLAVLFVIAFGVRPAIKATRPAPPPKAPKELAAASKKDAAKALKDGKGKAGKEAALAADGKELPDGKRTGADGQPALAPPEAAVDPERVRMQEIFDRVSQHLRSDPAQSSRLLQSWIHSD